MRPLERSAQYKSRVRNYTLGLAERYGVRIADVFADAVRDHEEKIWKFNHIGVDAPYILLGKNIILKEYYFDSGPVRYCLIYEILDDRISLVSLWHASGMRGDGSFVRIWKK
jgi:hypothetical protein